ncbi:MAG: lytic transglycosylase domain-containing protein [Clostridium sp.]|uniref:lytic transglycosylase domain-containing protein n=1 Tax=Clostridium sp. TaxID=1506 RepID=UPI00306A227F
MSYDVSGVYNGVNAYVNNVIKNGVDNTSKDSNENKITQNKYVQGVGIVNDSLNSATEPEGFLTGLMSMGLMSGGMNGGDKNGESSSVNGFSMIMSSLLKAMGEKNAQTQMAIDKNSKNNGLEELSNIITRPLGNNTGGVNPNIPNAKRIENAIASASEKYGVSKELINAIIKTESNYNPNAVSPAGAMGLMQLMPQNVSHYGVNDPFSIEENIDAGTRHINDYLKNYNYNLDMALVAYNFGPGNMASRGIKSSSDFYKLPSETKNYLIKINNLL